MKDLTEHSIGEHIVQMALPIAAGMFFQTLYFLVDLYFVAHLGSAALAGVGAAGNMMFIVFAVTQVLGVGTVMLISHAVGRSAVFQGLGNTVPAVQSSATRIVSFVGPALWLAAQPQFQLVQLWYASVASMTTQALVSLWLVRRQFRRRLSAAGDAVLGLR